jgi:hypothetical protein
MIDVAAFAAVRPALGEFGIEEEKVAEGEEPAGEMREMTRKKRKRNSPRKR